MVLQQSQDLFYFTQCEGGTRSLPHQAGKSLDRCTLAVQKTRECSSVRVGLEIGPTQGIFDQDVGGRASPARSET
ncbi:MAG: hypothetical protein ABS59_03775 [Methylobacterium sp. SCN 67-24]|nr:MAG: hypothetical protein ABS59_03775 [Methylobacterium sp. SCN 67-24]